MYKKLTTLLIIYLMFFTALPANGHENEDISIINSSATATIEVESDTVSFSAAIVTENKDLDKAVIENNEKSQKVYESLKKVICKEGKIKTSKFRVSPRYEYNKTSRKSELRGYEVSNHVYVKTQKLDEIGNLLQTATKNGANRIENLSFSVKDREKYCYELLEKAAVKARKKAETIAKALNVKITGIKKVSSGCNKLLPGPVRFGAGTMAEKAASIPIEKGDMDITASVTIDFIIEE